MEQALDGGGQSAAHAPRASRHPLEVKPRSSDARFKQSRYDIFNPMPCKNYYVASSGGGCQVL